MATYAAQMGYEAAILQNVAADVLQNIAREVVEQQDTHLLPQLRYLPGASVSTASPWRGHGLDIVDQRLEGENRSFAGPSLAGPNKVVLDERRLSLELGSGGDVTLRAGWRPQQVSFPRRMDVLRVWMRLRRQHLHGQLGNAMDGAPDGTVGDQGVQNLENELSAYQDSD